MRLGAERTRDTVEWIAVGAGRPVAAGQRHDRRPDRGHGILEGIGHRPDRCTLPDPDDPAVSDARPEDVGREPPDDPSGQVLRPGERGCEMDCVEREALL